MVKLPQNKSWTQINKGDLLGQLFMTRQIDFSSPGILRLAQRTRYVGQTTASFGTMLLAVVYGNFNATTTTYKYWLLSQASIYTLSDDLGTFAIDALGSTPTLHAGSDGCTWNGNLYVTKTSKVDKLAAGVWTNNWSTTAFATTTTGFPHPIEPNVTNTNLLVGDGNLLKSIIADGTVSTALTLPSNLQIRWIRRGLNVNFIGCQGVQGGRGAVVVWDGLATTTGANYIIYLDTPRPITGCLDSDGIMNIMTLDGRLLKYNGSGAFIYVSELPPFREYLARQAWGNSQTTEAEMVQRGSTLIKGRMHFVFETQSDLMIPSMLPQFLTGVWVYDPENKSFYHKYAASNSNTITEFGQTMSSGGSNLSAISPVFIDNALGTVEPTAAVAGDLIFAGRLNTSTVSGTALRTVVSATTGESRGQFSTVRVESDELTNRNIAIWCKFQGVLTSTDKIIFKYRTARRDPFILGDSNSTDKANWTSTTTFTTTDTAMTNAVVGDEIFVMTGNGAGCTAHITVIALNGGTYTITLDEAITGVSNGNNAFVMVENWKRLSTQISYTDTKGYKKISLPKAALGKWIEVKGEMRGEGGRVGIEELALVSNAQEPAL